MHRDPTVVAESIDINILVPLLKLLALPYYERNNNSYRV